MGPIGNDDRVLREGIRNLEIVDSSFTNKGGWSLRTLASVDRASSLKHTKEKENWRTITSWVRYASEKHSLGIAWWWRVLHEAMNSAWHTDIEHAEECQRWTLENASICVHQMTA
jgi:hypothetical protein